MTLSLWMLQNTLAAGCLAILVAIGCRFGRLSPAVRHALWLLVLIKLVTPPLVEFPIPRSIFGTSFDLASQEKTTDGRTLAWIAAERFYDFSESGPDEELDARSSVGIPSDTAIDRSLASDRPIDDVASRVPRATTDAAGESSTASGRIARWPWDRWFFWGWCSGTTLFVLIQGRRLVNLRRMKNRGRIDDGPLTELVGRVALLLRVRQPPVWIVPELPSPALCAWGRASLLWPEKNVAPFTEAGERAVVLHELAHLRRRDHWVGWMELVTGCVWWWNPLFWLVRRQLHENAELACDSWVVALLPEERRAYAEALIDVAQGEAPSNLAGVVLGVGDGSRKLMERRLIMIMRGKARYQIPAVGLAVLALVALVTIPRWTIGREQVQSGDVPLISRGEPVAQMARAPINSRNSPDIGAVKTNAPHFAEQQATHAFADADVGDEEESDAEAFSPSVSQPNAPPTLGFPADEASPKPVNLADAPVAESPGDEWASDEQDEPLSVATTEVAPPINAAPADDQIKRLEAQLSAIQSELNSLRTKQNPAGKTSTGTTDPSRKSWSTIADANHPKKSDSKPKQVHSYFNDRSRTLLDSADDSSIETVVMTRSTYKLPPGRAAILEKALRELLNDDVEIKVKGDSLQITAAQEDQDAIHQLIRLMQRKGREPAKPTVDQGIRPGAVNVIEDYKPPHSKELPARPVERLDNQPIPADLEDAISRPGTPTQTLPDPNFRPAEKR